MTRTVYIIATDLSNQVADHWEVVILNGMVERRLPRLAVLDVNVSLGINQQLEGVSAPVLGRKVERGVPYNQYL